MILKEQISLSLLQDPLMHISNWWKKKYLHLSFSYPKMKKKNYKLARLWDELQHIPSKEIGAAEHYWGSHDEPGQERDDGTSGSWGEEGRGGSWENSFTIAANDSGFAPRSQRAMRTETVWRSSPVSRMFDMRNAKSSESLAVLAASGSIAV